MRTLLVLVCSALPLAGQQVLHTAHPQETLQFASGNYSPLGCFNTGSGAEARAQILLRAFELPGPGAVLQGIEVRAWQNQGLTYSSLRILVARTSATSLSMTFAANLQSPQTVLNATALAVSYTSPGWTAIQFTTPYVHDDTSSLVLDIKKIVDPNALAFVTMDTGQWPVRTDRPQMVYRFGNPGSNASTSPTAFAAAEPIALRLRWTGAPTLWHAGDAAASGNQYGLGGSVVHVVQGTPQSAFLNVISTSVLSAPAPLPPVVGLMRINGIVFALGVLGASGEQQQVIGIPTDPRLVGLYLAYQSGTLDAVTNVPMFTNGMDHFVNP